jgi:antitoxin component of MazEF toxin-antitoxin module
MSTSAPLVAKRRSVSPPRRKTKRKRQNNFRIRSSLVPCAFFLSVSWLIFCELSPAASAVERKIRTLLGHATRVRRANLDFTLADCSLVKHSITSVTKTITKVGNSQGIIFDAALMDMARLKVGDQVNVTVHEGGSIVLTPVDPIIDPKTAAASAKRLIRKNSALFKRLS